MDAVKPETQVPQPDASPQSKPLDAKSETEFRKRTYAIIANAMDVLPSTTRPQTLLYNQSFQLNFLVDQLELSFEITISDSDGHSFRTAEDVVKCVEREAASHW